MLKVHYSERPTAKESIGLGVVRYRWDISEVTEKRETPETDEEYTEWQCYEVDIKEGVASEYASLVTAIITQHYSIDDQIAILANKGDGNDAHQQEYDEFEQWRQYAKTVARTLV